MNATSPAQQIAAWADKLRDISALGLMFANSSYDRERYQTLQDMAMSMLALATGDRLDQLEPLRAPVFSRPTPFAVGDAAVIDRLGRILLIQRADNAKWAMPGGALEELEAGHLRVVDGVDTDRLDGRVLVFAPAQPQRGDGVHAASVADVLRQARVRPYVPGGKHERLRHHQEVGS